ncbi:MAG: hypothetical protein ACE5NN_01045 [Candidatus Bathyarchaeia archaeon]
MARITREDLRNLTGLTDVEIEDSRLDQIIADSESLVDGYTGKSWSASDSNYSKIQTATRFLAASLIYDSLPSTPEINEKAQRYHEKAMAMLRAMRVLDSGPLKRA